MIKIESRFRTISQCQNESYSCTFSSNRNEPSYIIISVTLSESGVTTISRHGNVSYDTINSHGDKMSY